MKSDSILQKQVLQLQQFFPLIIEKRIDTRESFSITDSKNGVILRYSNELLGLYALRKLEEAWKTDDFSIFGEFYPKTLIRAFWPKYSLLEGEDFAGIASLGFNTLVIEESQFTAIEQAMEWGFKILYKPTLPKEWEAVTPWDENYSTNLNGLFLDRRFDAIIWESPYFLRAPRKKMLQNNQLFADLLKKEIFELEKIAPLFYLLPEQKRYEISKLDKLRNNTFIPLKVASQVHEQVLESGGILKSLPKREFMQFVWKSKSRPKKGEYSEIEHYIIGKNLIETSEDSLMFWLNLYQKDPKRIYALFNEISFHYKLLQEGIKREDLIPRFLKLEKELEEEKRHNNTHTHIKVFEEALSFLRQMRD